ncbi:RICIN domain-containing protein [Streptomyces polychromogenes]|nr:RICIN domain-containing protein [Streptomyces polychromogenes]
MHTAPKTAHLLRSAALTCALLTAGPAPAAYATPAGAAPAADTIQTLRNDATSACLDDSEYGVRTYTCLGNDHQKWNVHRWADGTRELRNTKTGRCLTDHPEGNVRPYACDKAKDQSWTVHRYPDGAVELKNQQTGLCLDDSPAHHLRTFPCGTHSGKSPYQTWR